MELLTNLSNWLTPTTLFLLLNFTIGTIFFTNRFGGSKKHHPPHDGSSSHAQAPPLARAPSFTDRVKSFNFHLYNSPPPESEIHFSGSSDPNQNLNPTPSLLQRVKSINFRFPQHNPAGDYAAYELQIRPDETKRVDPVDISGSEIHFSGSNPNPNPSPSLFQRVKSINFRFPHHNPDGDYAAYEQQQTRSDETNRVDPRSELSEPIGAPSLLQRVKSIKLSSLYRSESEPDPIVGEKTPATIKKKKKKTTTTTKKMTKSASEKVSVGHNGGEKEEKETVEEVEKRRPETMRVERTTSIGDGEEGVDDKASDFIEKFKQQLKLQRLDSFLRYREMLKNQ